MQYYFPEQKPLNYRAIVELQHCRATHATLSMKKVRLYVPPVSDMEKLFMTIWECAGKSGQNTKWLPHEVLGTTCDLPGELKCFCI